MICVRSFTSVGNVFVGATSGCTGSNRPTSMPRAAAVSGGRVVPATAQRAIVTRAMLTFLNFKWLPPEARQHPPQPLLELDFRLPAQHLPGSGDVGLANLRIVDRQRLVDDLALGRRDADDGLRELLDRELVGVAEVHRQVLAALGEQVETADQVVDVTKAARLRAVAEDGDRLVLERLPHEGRDRAPVVRAHARPVGVEDADDRGVHALLLVVRHRQRLGVALRLVVDAARPDRVDVAPVALGLRVDLRIAVHLARRGEEEARALELGEPERVVRAVRADLERVQRLPQVVDADDAVVLLEQVLTEMGAEKPGPSGHDRGWHPKDAIGLPGRPREALRSPYPNA